MREFSEGRPQLARPLLLWYRQATEHKPHVILVPSPPISTPGQRLLLRNSFIHSVIPVFLFLVPLKATRHRQFSCLCLHLWEVCVLLREFWPTHKEVNT